MFWDPDQPLSRCNHPPCDACDLEYVHGPCTCFDYEHLPDCGDPRCPHSEEEWNG